MGTLFLILGTIGIILPVIPTTPLLLLSSYFYLRSYTKLYNWLLNHKVFGRYIYNYVKHKAIPKRAKISAVCLIVVTITITVILINKLITYIILPIIALCVIIYILSLKTLEVEKER